MSRLPIRTTVAAAACAALAVVLAPVASAGQAPAPVSGWTPGTVTCSNGIVSVFPVIIANATSVTQTASVTVPTSLSAGVQVVSSPSQVACNQGSGAFASLGNGYSGNFTVQPGQYEVMWLGIGTSTSLNAGSANIALGGLPTGTKGQSWYDFAVSLNGASAAWSVGSSFSSMQVQYQNTGGLDPATNGQNLFNIVQCTSGASSVAPTNTLLTPYSSSWTTGPTYGINQPVCAGWYPQGQFQPITQLPGSPFTLQAIQTYNGGADLAMAGSGTATITSALIRWVGPSSKTGPGGPTLTDTVVLSNVPGSTGGWWVQDPLTQQWAVVGATPPSSIATGQYTSATVAFNGMPVGSS